MVRIEGQHAIKSTSRRGTRRGGVFAR